MKGLPIEEIENCYSCNNLTQSKNANFICLFKNVNMGQYPYYPRFIPKDAIFNHGERVCKYEPRKNKV